MPNIPDMFAERLKLQKRIMTLLEPIIQEQAAAEAKNEAAMRQAYARGRLQSAATTRPRWIVLMERLRVVADRRCPSRLAAEKPAAMVAPRPPEENRSARYERRRHGWTDLTCAFLTTRPTSKSPLPHWRSFQAGRLLLSHIGLLDLETRDRLVPLPWSKQLVSQLDALDQAPE